MVLVSLLMIAMGFGVALPLTWWVRRVSVRIGHLDEPGGHKGHVEAVPATGGIGIFAGIVVPMLAGLGLVWILPSETWSGLVPDIEPHLSGIASRTPMAFGLITCLLVLHVMGLVDDRRNLGPGVKLAVQMGVALVMVFMLDVRLFEFLGVAGSVIVSVLWLVVITNAFNFLDNMDGLSGGVAAITAGLFMTAALLTGQWFIASMLGLMIGAVLGFLVFNFPRASIFMGDGGSLVIGMFVAFCSVRVTYYDPAAGNGSAVAGWWGVLTPVVVLAIPLYDFVSAVGLRLAQGKSPFVGDQQHFSHRLVNKGLTRQAAVGVIWACTMATGLGGVMLSYLSAWQACLVAAQTAAVLLVLALYERAGGSAGES